MNRLSKNQSTGSINQVTTTDATMVGASLAVIPASIELLQKQYKSKTFVALRAYDENNQTIITLSALMTKAARNEWEELKVSYQVEQDGFVEIVGSKDDRLSVVNFGHDNWIQVAKHGQGESVASARAGAPSPESPFTQPPYTQPHTSDCVSWWLCNAYSCEYLYTDCQLAPDNGDGGGGPSGGGGTYVPEEQACAVCKQKAQNEHDDNLTLAKAVLYSSVGVGCSVAGFQTYVAFNAAGWWVNLVPGIGTAAIQALSALGGITVDISCLVTAVLTFNAAESTIENNYYKDMRDCRERYHNCN